MPSQGILKLSSIAATLRGRPCKANPSSQQPHPAEPGDVVAGTCTRRSGRVDQHTLLKANMNHKANVNTAKSDIQAKNAIVPTLQKNLLRQHLGDIEGQAQAAQTLTEICFEELDRAGEAITDEAGHRAVLRLDVLMKSIFRNVELIQEAVDAAGTALLDAQGAAA